MAVSSVGIATGVRPRVVIFDMGGVLLQPDPGVMQEAVTLAGSQLSPTAAITGMLRALCDAQLTDLHSLSASRFHALWSSATGEPADVLARVTSALSQLERMNRELYRVPTPGLHDCLRRLTAAGVRLAVLSNSDGRVGERLRISGVSSYFEAVFDSTIEGYSKPDVRFYELGAARLDVALQHCWYVTDMVHDVHQGVLRLGLGGVAILDVTHLYPHRGDFHYVADLAELTTAVLALSPDHAARMRRRFR